MSKKFLLDGLHLHCEMGARTSSEGDIGRRGTEIQDMESRTAAYKLKKKKIPGKCSRVSVQLVSHQYFLMIATCLVLLSLAELCGSCPSYREGWLGSAWGCGLTKRIPWKRTKGQGIRMLAKRRMKSCTMDREGRQEKACERRRQMEWGAERTGAAKEQEHGCWNNPYWWQEL